MLGMFLLNIQIQFIHHTLHCCSDSCQRIWGQFIKHCSSLTSACKLHLHVCKEEVSQRRAVLSGFIQEWRHRARNGTLQPWVSVPLFTFVINKTRCCDSNSDPGLLSGSCCSSQCKKTVTFPPQNASKLKGKCSKRTLIKEGCMGLQVEDCFTLWPDIHSLDPKLQEGKLLLWSHL